MVICLCHITNRLRVSSSSNQSPRLWLKGCSWWVWWVSWRNLPRYVSYIVVGTRFIWCMWMWTERKNLHDDITMHIFDSVVSFILQRSYRMFLIVRMSSLSLLAAHPAASIPWNCQPRTSSHSMYFHETRGDNSLISSCFTEMLWFGWLASDVSRPDLCSGKRRHAFVSEKRGAGSSCARICGQFEC